MKRIVVSTSVVLVLSILTCYSQDPSNSEKQKVDLTTQKITNNMKSFVSIFEIPATEISRAINFYQEILDVKIEEMQIPGMHMGVFPYEEQMVTGVIVKGEGYQPSVQGVTIYLNGGDNLQIILDRVEKNDGKILVPKTPHGDESGFFALFLDTEGNRIGLHSPN